MLTGLEAVSRVAGGINGVVPSGNLTVSPLRNVIIVGAACPESAEWQEECPPQGACVSLTEPMEPCAPAAGAPNAFAGVAVPSPAASPAAAAITLSLNANNPDVAVGYLFSISYLPSSTVTFNITEPSTSADTIIAVKRDDSRITVNAGGDTLIINLGLPSRWCNTANTLRCGTGDYRLVGFWAASYWPLSTGGTPISDPSAFETTSYRMPSNPAVNASAFIAFTVGKCWGVVVSGAWLLAVLRAASCLLVP